MSMSYQYVLKKISAMGHTLNNGLTKGLVFVATFLLSVNAVAGFSVSGTQLLDGNGQPFVMRGMNHPHTWYLGETSAFANIAATGANTVRVVLSNGDRWTRNSKADVANVIALCKRAQLICLLEVHDVTGSGEENAAGTMARAAQYWVDIKGALKGQEDYVLINIANEPMGNGPAPSRWVNEQSAAIRTLRAAGLTHTLVIDAANWGQDWQNIMLDNASQVAQADSLSNTVFSVHMYEVYQNYNRINNYVTGFLTNHNLPLIVGEFGQDHQGQFVDADSIMRVAQEQGIGYLGWSWSGNGSCCVALDIVNNFNPKSLTPWGRRLINGVNGIAKTSVKASVYGGVTPPLSSSSAESSSSSSSSMASSSLLSSSSVASSSAASSSSSAGGGNCAQQCQWYSDAPRPLCTTQSTGWGWENNQSCIGRTLCQTGQQGNGGIVRVCN